MIGQRAPAFASRENVTVVSVWAPWCQPCTRELPRIEREVWQRFQPRIAVVGVAVGEHEDAIRRFNRDARLTFQLVADPDRKISEAFGAAHQIPQTFVVDRSGRIVYEAVGYDEKHFDRVVSAVQRAIERE